MRPGAQRRVCLIALDRAAGQAVARWLERAHIASADFASADVIWYHSSTTDPPVSIEPPRRPCGILCTGGAARLPSLWGWEPCAPNDVAQQVWPPARSSSAHEPVGVAAFRTHPLFAGLPGGALLWQPRPGERFTSVSYCDGIWPQRARVIGVTRTGMQLDARRATIWELQAPIGGITLALGLHLPFSHDEDTEKPRLTDHHVDLQNVLDRLLLNALEYCAGGTCSDVIGWPPPGNISVIHDAQLVPSLIPRLQDGLIDLAGLPVRSHLESDAPLTMMGKRAFAVGQARSGVCELWVHPTRVVKDLTVRDFSAREFTLSTTSAERANEQLREQCFLPHELGGLIWHWHALRSTELALSWTIDLQVSGPYPPGMLGPLRWSALDRWLLVHAADERDIAFYCFDHAVDWLIDVVEGSAPELRVRASTHLQDGYSLTLAVMGSSPGGPGLLPAARVLHAPSTLVRSASARAMRTEQQRLQVRTPAQHVNDAWRWALHSLESACVESPNVGRSLALPPGDSSDFAEHAFSFTTRSSVETGLATLALGESEAARATIEFLLGKQSPTGLVPSSCSTSGFAHYSGSEASLLLAFLYARYFAWTADLSFARSHWQRLQRALVNPPLHASAAIVFRELAFTAESIGEASDARRMRTLADHAGATPQSSDQTAWPEFWIGATEFQPSLAVGKTSPSQTVLRFVNGVLGALPDAARHRIELRPAVPIDWAFLAVENLSLGDGQFAVRFARRDGWHTFALVPLSGTVPIRVIFEPWIAASGIRRVMVDGRTAALNLHRQGERWVCPLQVVLDNERVIAIETTDRDP
ncbi:MAG: hypothetical protein ACRENP_03340 [Longimicrobiales bacterium]